ncbi:MAG: hypothetical protein ACYS26_20445 [Planctomycetota bacterium]|jgi:hypothetical protein
MKTPSIATLALLALAPQALAQDFTFRGKVEDVSGTQNQFFVDCTDVALTSSAVNLNLFIGQSVEISGFWNGSSAQPAIDATSVTVVTETFEIGGGAKLGETSSLGFTGAPGTQALGFLSGNPGFTPFGDQLIFLDQTNILLQGGGTIGGTGILEVPFQIPNNPSLLGFEFFGQGALIGNDGSILLTNPDCKTIDD